MHLSFINTRGQAGLASHPSPLRFISEQVTGLSGRGPSCRPNTRRRGGQGAGVDVTDQHRGAFFV